MPRSAVDAAGRQVGTRLEQLTIGDASFVSSSFESAQGTGAFRAPPSAPHRSRPGSIEQRQWHSHPQGDELLQGDRGETGALGQADLSLLEEVENHSAAKAVLLETLVEWNGEDHWSAVLRDQRQPASFGLSHETAGATPEIAETEHLERFHGVPSLCVPSGGLS